MFYMFTTPAIKKQAVVWFLFFITSLVGVGKQLYIMLSPSCYCDLSIKCISFCTFQLPSQATQVLCTFRNDYVHPNL